ncbi:microcystin-dependent protein [Azospirillum sp. OGB3]|uniref:phage tail protein n=1 Tax=Azospirillum sp. OGB3 TaxID=2587012 RepID=UPI00160649D7|nr:tail fiber protein [Azospirillum sp. OGB3]MBB3265887.1 microcystin-dependent protein [Azospirillum sp. OGB3]
MDFYLGTIFPFAGSFAPVNTQQCLGQAVNTQQYQALWAVTAGAFGGGQSSPTFNLPDLRGRVMVGTGSSPYTSTTLNPGNSGGTQFTTINGSNLPAHTHAASFQSGSVPFNATVTVPLNPAVGTSNSPSAIPAVLGGQLLTEPGLGVTLDGPFIPASSLPTPPTGSSLTGALSTQGTVSGGPTGASIAVSAGGGATGPTPLNNLQPYQSLFFFIFMLGYFPSRD